MEPSWIRHCLYNYDMIIMKTDSLYTCRLIVMCLFIKLQMYDITHLHVNADVYNGIHFNEYHAVV